jgi:C-methyltransferase C-terminal domain
MMHDPDQAGALAERADRVASGGALLLQYHSLDTIVRLGQWNALRHGHFAYYSTSALVGMLEANGLNPRFAWRFELYGGTMLLAATRGTGPGGVPDDSVQALLSDEARLGIRDRAVVGRLGDHAEAHARALHRWLVAQRAAGRRVLGYGAASRAVALLCRAEVDRQLLPAVADSSPSKHDRRMPGTDIPIIQPGGLATDPPDAVLLFVPDLLTEVRRDFPQVEAAGGAWVDADALHA